MSSNEQVASAPDLLAGPSVCRRADLPQSSSFSNFGVIEEWSRDVASGTDRRLMRATREFQCGDVIVEEDPFVCAQFVWNAACGTVIFPMYSACERCMRPLESAVENARRLSKDESLTLPYPELDESLCKRLRPVEAGDALPGFRYCSESCRLQAWHQYGEALSKMCSEPDFTQLIADWKECHPPPESTSIMLPLKLIAIYRQASSESVRSSFLTQLQRFQAKHRDPTSGLTHKLLREDFQGQIARLRELFAKVCYEEALADSIFSAEGFNRLWAMIGTNGQGIGLSSFNAWNRVVESQVLPQIQQHKADAERLSALLDSYYAKIEEATGVDFMLTEGSGLYSLQSACNHSCDANAQVEFRHGDARLSLVALRAIEPGSEVCISYLDECALQRSRHSRQKLLAQDYLFACACTRCAHEASEQEDETSCDETTSDDDDDEDAMQCD